MMAAAIAAMTLGELLGSAAGIHAALQIDALVLDDRQARAGAAFLAVPGARTHGLRFAQRALDRGAEIVLYEPSDAYPVVPEPSLAVSALTRRIGDLARTFYGRGKPAPDIAGVTGTNGKTTVAYLIAQATSLVAGPCGYIGTLGFGVPPHLEAHQLTTPDCLTLHRETAVLATSRVALEVSSHALEQDRVAGLDIGVAAFTNLTRDHLDHHGDWDSYARAKTRLFTRPEVRTAVLNLDDPFAESLRAALSSNVRVLGTTMLGASDAALSVRSTALGLDGLELEIGGLYGRATLRSPLIGQFNAENLAVALGVLLAWDASIERACAALAHCAPPRGRMEVLGGGSNPYVVIDYAHTPDALERVLGTLRSVTAGDVTCVLGCGGNRDRGKRALMGEIAGRLAEHVVLTDDNPRNEEPARITADIRAGLGSHRDVVVVHARDAAIAQAIDAARAGDTVLIAGKGHETIQVIGDERRPFDDSAVAAAALEMRT
jgi:UDP-N-acetylmuramoyl-L-alanyl-D-glutamate--2,6-diaminopimelate ligase